MLLYKQNQLCISDEGQKLTRRKLKKGSDNSSHNLTSQSSATQDSPHTHTLHPPTEPDFIIQAIIFLQTVQIYCVISLSDCKLHYCLFL